LEKLRVHAPDTEGVLLEGINLIQAYIISIIIIIITVLRSTQSPFLDQIKRERAALTLSSDLWGFPQL
jgi:hypothetical protein